MTEVEARAIVPVDVIGPPVNPTPVDTWVTDPVAVEGVDQNSPPGQAAQAVKTLLLAPGFKATKEPTPVPAKSWPGVVNEERGMALAAILTALPAVASAVLAVEHALLAAESAMEAAEDAEKAKSLAVLTALGVAA
jgi:hypothetical protein